MTELNQEQAKVLGVNMNDFWDRLTRKKDESNVVRVDGVHYIYQPDTNRGFQGYGGREFHIRFHDGREVITRNLWHQGDIPENLREILPDNAIFTKGMGKK